MISTAYAAGATSKSVYLRGFTASTGLPYTAGAFNTSGIAASYIRAGASATTITLVTQTAGGAYSSGGFVHVTGGVYRLDVPNAAFTSGADYVDIVVSGIADVVFSTVHVDIVGADPRAAALDANVTSIANNAITAASIATGAITNAKFAAGAIDAASIASNAITDAKINSGALTAAKFGASAITATVLADSAITSAKLATGAITTSTFASGAINAAAIATDAITAAKIAANAIADTKIATGAITAAKFAAGAIDAAAIASNAITAAKIATDAIGSAQLAASAVTEIQTGLATTANVAAVEADTQDIQTRLPAALTGDGLLPVDVKQINDAVVNGNGTSGNKWRG